MEGDVVRVQAASGLDSPVLLVKGVVTGEVDDGSLEGSGDGAGGWWMDVVTVVKNKAGEGNNTQEVKCHLPGIYDRLL